MEGRLRFDDYTVLDWGEGVLEYEDNLDIIREDERFNFIEEYSIYSRKEVIRRCMQAKEAKRRKIILSEKTMGCLKKVTTLKT